MIDSEEEKYQLKEELPPAFHLSEEDVRKAAQKKQAAWISLLVALILFSVKVFAFFLTDSRAIFSDALEGIVNILGSIGALFALKIASKPADSDHPYGHGKAEYFSAAFEGGLLAFAAVMIFFASVQSLITGVELQRLGVGLWLIVAAGVANLLLGLYLRKIGKKTNSAALVASGAHVLSDFWTSFGVVLALLLIQLTDWVWLDPIVAMVIGMHLLRASYGVVRDSTAGLMDERDEGMIQKIGKIFLKNRFPGIIRIHHTRVIRSGDFHHIDAHLVVPEFWSVSEAHVESDRFELKVMKDYPSKGEVRFHLDPCRKAYCEACDYPDCSVRQEPFKELIPYTLEELLSPVEPEEFRVSKESSKS
jgi:cation diffusion facilitator family transporter